MEDKSAFVAFQDDVDLGLQSIQKAIDMSIKRRHKKGLLEAVGDWFRTPNYDEYTDGGVY